MMRKPNKALADASPVQPLMLEAVTQLSKAPDLDTSLPDHTHYDDQDGRNVTYHPIGDETCDDNTSEPSLSHPVSAFESSSTLRWWLPEVLAAVISTAAVVAILIMLKICDGQAMRNIKLPGSLTVNVAVAAISTIGRIALMVSVGSAMSQEAWLWFTDIAQIRRCRSRLIDLELSNAASRGPWGSLVFLISARRRWLAYLGAAVTIASLALGTLTQQLIGYDYFPVPIAYPIVGSANIPRAESLGVYYENATNPVQTLPFKLRAAIFNGMFGEQIAPLSASCPTGNCTWPTTPTLAICGQCEPNYITDSQCDGGSCTYTLGSNSTISLADASRAVSGIGFRVNVTTPAETNINEPLKKLYITQFDVIGVPYQSLIRSFNNSGVRTSQCAMWFCVNAYKVSTRSGVQSQQTPFTYSVVDRYPPHIPLNTDPKFVSTTSSSFLEIQGYSVSHRGVFVFRDSLTKIFNGTATLGLSNSSAESDGVDSVWKASDNLDPWIKNLATSMTNVIRTQDETVQLNELYRGSSFELGIKVRWQWMWPLIALVGLSHVFLILVMMYTAWSAIAPWKGSFLIPLFFDVDQRLKRRAGQPGLLHKSQALQEEVGKARVYLKHQPGTGWVFEVR